MNRRFISRVRPVSPRLFPIIRTRSENNFSNFRFRAKRIFFEKKEYDSRALNARRILKKNLLVRELIRKINLSDNNNNNNRTYFYALCPNSDLFSVLSSFSRSPRALQ